MGLSKFRIGQLVEQTTEINTDYLFGADDVRGMTITKQIIPTKADVSVADLSKFLVIHPKEFVFNPRTHGKHIGFGYNNTDVSFIISWNNIGFRIRPEMELTVSAEYLFLHFNRDEWDREACYRSWGSSTEVFSWDALCEMELTLPNLPTQQKYVDIYNAMVANQQAYERGLEDLKLTCDAYVENLRRRIPCERIGRYITECNAKNDIGLTLDFVRGISTDKEFIDTKANMDGVSLSNYKIVSPNEIAFISDTSRRGDKISLRRIWSAAPLPVSCRTGDTNRKGRNIPTTSINRIIKNPIYTGVIRNGDSQSEVLPELQIIDAETYERAQQMMEKRVT